MFTLHNQLVLDVSPQALSSFATNLQIIDRPTNVKRKLFNNSYTTKLMTNPHAARAGATTARQKCDRWL